MNLVTWNCNMAFRKKYQWIIDSDIDLVVIQECENEEKLSAALDVLDYNEIIWYGNNPNKGIAIISFNDYHIDLKSDFNKEFEYIIPVSLSNSKSTISLFAIWAMPYKKSKLRSYVGQIWGAINYYKSAFANKSILVGDFNSNKMWDKERKIGNHSEVVSFLYEFGIQSLYHKFRNEDHGDEKEPTLYLLKKEAKKYHMDYCFVSKEMITKKSSIEVGKYEDWISRSDHMPIWGNHLNF